jgi:hypothetical protein
VAPLLPRFLVQDNPIGCLSGNFGAPQFVPLGDATVGPGYLKVAYDKKQVKEAPSIGTDGELLAEDEKAVFAHYELAYRTGEGGERRLARR